MSDLAAALQVAIRVHAAQADKQGKPYLLHVLRVVESVSDEAKVVAALHDVIEDGNDSLLVGWTDGLDYEEIAAVGVLTRVPGRSYCEYIEHIALRTGFTGQLAREVKLADLRDNLGRIPDSLANGYLTQAEHDGWKSLRRRYEKAIETLGAAA